MNRGSQPRIPQPSSLLVLDGTAESRALPRSIYEMGSSYCYFGVAVTGTGAFFGVLR